MAGNAPGSYEIPLEMREFAERSVEQARKAFDGFVGAAHRTAAAADPVGAVQSQLRDAGRKAIAFAETNVAASLTLAQRLVQARDMGEILELQAAFLREQLAAMQEQAVELGVAAAPRASEGRG